MFKITLNFFVLFAFLINYLEILCKFDKRLKKIVKRRLLLTRVKVI